MSLNTCDRTGSSHLVQQLDKTIETTDDNDVDANDSRVTVGIQVSGESLDLRRQVAVGQRIRLDRRVDLLQSASYLLHGRRCRH